MLTLLTALAIAADPAFVAGSSGDALEPGHQAPDIVAPTVTFATPDALINAEDVDLDVFPETGGVLAEGRLEIGASEMDLRLFICSSTLIAPDVVLTAAHCVDPDSLSAAAGLGNQGTISDLQFAWSRQRNLSRYGQAFIPPEWPDDVAFAREAVFHEDWVGVYGVQLGVARNYDIGLIFLEEAVETPYATLPTREEADGLVEDMTLDVVGWGQQEQTPPGQAPRNGTYGIKQWGESVLSKIGDYEFQVGAKKSDVRKCHGDSGGPSFAEIGLTEAGDESPENLNTRIVGVTSHAYDYTDCAQKGGVDTRIDAYLSWIEEEMTKRCEDGTRAWCEVPGVLPPVWSDGTPGWEDPPLADVGGCAKGGCNAGSNASPVMVLGLVALLRRRKC